MTLFFSIPRRASALSCPVLSLVVTCTLYTLMALVRAATVGDASKVFTLLQAQGRFAASITTRAYALEVACTRNWVDVVTVLLADADIDTVTATERMSWATRGDAIDVVKMLYHPGMDLRAHELLATAAWFGSVRVATWLLDHGASATAKDGFGQSAINIAASKTSLPMLKLLLASGPDAHVNINIRGCYGNTPLYSAAFFRRRENVQFLLSMGADVNAVNDDGKTAVHASARYLLKAGVLPLLITAGARLDMKDIDGDTPLHIACCNDVADTVQFLLSAGASVHEVGDQSRSPLHTAVQRHSFGCVSTLLSAGAALDALDDAGKTPLLLVHWEFTFAYEMMKMLVDAGASVDVADALEGWTPLHLTAKEGLVKAVQFLLSAGADVGRVSSAGVTPRQVAELSGNTKVCKILAYAEGARWYRAREARTMVEVRTLLMKECAQWCGDTDGDEVLGRVLTGQPWLFREVTWWL